MATRYAHVNIIAKDWRRLCDFYEAVFDCEPWSTERDHHGPHIDDLTGMPGMPNHRMAVTGFKTSVEGDKTLVLTLAKPLMAGSYQVAWHVVSTDTHRIQGNLAFTVK